TPLTAYTNWETLVDGASVWSWLRSPGGDDNLLRSGLHADGCVTVFDINESLGVRPALWVSASIFA
ncbi:MAG: hypothetical protein LBB67_00775, partial [Oscillospiraceae bacterium]|nr:hypothetical protein [Oscillospiraceae bacterium]